VGSAVFKTVVAVLEHGWVIPRLYAGGKVGGGIIGPYSPGSATAVAITVCFGPAAAASAAAEEPWE